jgi:hypothetical protein
MSLTQTHTQLILERSWALNSTSIDLFDLKGYWLFV